MDYYLLLPDDTEDDINYDTNLLGTVSFNKLWPGGAMNALINIVNNKPELLDDIRIITDQKKNVTLEEFLKLVETLYVQR